MPFGPGATYHDTYSHGDLFYGLQEPRGKLMEFLGAQKERTTGSMINYYNVGDYGASVAAPSDNAKFTEALASSQNPKHPDLLNRWQANPNNGDVKWALWKRKSKSGLWWATSVAKKKFTSAWMNLIWIQLSTKTILWIVHRGRIEKRLPLLILLRKKRL